MYIRGVFPTLFFVDLERAIRFYRDVLGFKVTDKLIDNGQIEACVVEAGGCNVTLQLNPAIAAKNGGGGLVIYTDDIVECHAEIKAAGVCVDEPELDEGQLDFEIVDPEGNPLTFCQILH
jgi:lactoylglutathione lyase